MVVSLALVTVLIAGCAVSDEVPEPGLMHPASPQAPQGTPAQLSDVLAIDESELPGSPPEMQRGMGHGEEHSMTGANQAGGPPK